MIVKTSPINRLQLYLELRQLVDRVRVVAAGALPQLLLHVEQLGAAGGHQLVLVARVLAWAQLVQLQLQLGHVPPAAHHGVHLRQHEAAQQDGLDMCPRHHGVSGPVVHHHRHNFQVFRNLVKFIVVLI